MDKLILNEYQSLCLEDFVFWQNSMEAPVRSIRNLFTNGFFSANNFNTIGVDSSGTLLNVPLLEGIFNGSMFSFESGLIGLNKSGYAVLDFSYEESGERINPVSGNSDKLYFKRVVKLAVVSRVSSVSHIRLGYILPDGTFARDVDAPLSVCRVFDANMLKKLGVLPSDPPRTVLVSTLAFRDKFVKPQRVVRVLVSGKIVSVGGSVKCYLDVVWESPALVGDDKIIAFEVVAYRLPVGYQSGAVSLNTAKGLSSQTLRWQSPWSFDGTPELSCSFEVASGFEWVVFIRSISEFMQAGAWSNSFRTVVKNGADGGDGPDGEL